jgi:hypothetical protein
MKSRRRHLVVAVPTAIALAALSQAPAVAAANHWQVLYETPRHVKAEACRTPVHTTSQGHKSRAVRWRGDARSASLGGSVQFHNNGGIGPFTSGWVGVTKGKTSKITNTYFLANEAVTIQMRVKTAKGTSKWSARRSINSLRLC